MPEETQPPPAPGGRFPFALADVICVAVGIAVADAVGEAVRSSLDFWPAFAVKVAAGGAVALAGIAGVAVVLSPPIVGQRGAVAAPAQAEPLGWRAVVGQRWRGWLRSMALRRGRTRCGRRRPGTWIRRIMGSARRAEV